METEKFNPSIHKERILSDAELISEGAEYDENGVLKITEQQEEAARKEMDAELIAKKLLQDFNLDEINTMVVALQTLSQSNETQQAEAKKAANLSVRLYRAYSAAVKLSQDKNELPK